MEKKPWEVDDPFISEILKKRIFYRSFYNTPMDPIVAKSIDILGSIKEIWIVDDPWNSGFKPIIIPPMPLEDIVNMTLSDLRKMNSLMEYMYG